MKLEEFKERLRKDVDSIAKKETNLDYNTQSETVQKLMLDHFFKTFNDRVESGHRTIMNCCGNYCCVDYITTLAEVSSGFCLCLSEKPIKDNQS